MSMSKHARLSTNTEFYPSEIADSDSSVVYKEVPYIVLKATKDFQYANQVFEVQLENAEWLETKQDGDTLYIEDNTYVDGYTDENGNFVAAKDPIEFLQKGDSSTGGDTTTGDVVSLQKVYNTAVVALVDAADAYDAALTAGGSTITTAKTALTGAIAARDAQKLVEDGAKDDYDEAVAAKANLDAEFQKYLDAKQEIADNQAKYTLGKGSAPAVVISPDDETQADTTAGKWKVYQSSDGTKYYLSYWVDSNGDPIEVKDGGGTASNAIADAKTALTTALAAGAKNGGDYETDMGSYRKYKADLDDYTTAKDFAKEVDDKIDAALKAIDDAGAEISGGKLDTTGVDANISSLEDAWQDEVKKTKAEQKKVDTAQTAYDEAVKGAAEKEKAAFDAALATRNEAGAALVAEAGIDGITAIEKMETQAGLRNASGILAKYTGLGVADITLDTAVKANVDIEVGSETLHIKVTKKTNSTIIVETDGYKLQKDDEIRLPLFVRT